MIAILAYLQRLKRWVNGIKKGTIFSNDWHFKSFTDTWNQALSDVYQPQSVFSFHLMNCIDLHCMTLTILWSGSAQPKIFRSIKEMSYRSWNIHRIQKPFFLFVIYLNAVLLEHFIHWQLLKNHLLEKFMKKFLYKKFVVPCFVLFDFIIIQYCRWLIEYPQINSWNSLLIVIIAYNAVKFT